MRRGWQTLRRDGVDLTEVQRPLAAAREGAVGENVRDQDVHRVGAKPIGEGLHHVSHPVGVRLVPLLLGIEQTAGVHDPRFLHEGQHGDVRDLAAVARRQPDDATLVGPAGLSPDVDLERIEQLSERGETPRVVVIAADDDDRDARAAVFGERRVDQALGLGTWPEAVKNISAEE